MIYAIDASGSLMGSPMRRMIDFVLRRGDAYKVIFFDTQVTKVCNPALLIYEDVPFGGGTAIQPVFDWVAEHEPGHELTVLTDGYWWENEVKSHQISASCYLLDIRLTTYIEVMNLRAFEFVGELR